MPSISFLGTGSGIPSADRFFSSAVIRLGNIHLLVDAGEPCVHSLRERGTLLSELDAVLITHGHVDHIGGLPALLQGALVLERSKPLAVFLPEEMLQPLRAWISALYLPEEALGFPLEWKVWSDGVAEVPAAGVSVTPHANKHLVRAYRGLPGADPSRPCLSFSLEVQQGEFRALFSGDLSSPDELSPLLEKPAVVLVSEMAHFSPGEMAATLRGSEIHSLCLVHLSEDQAGDRADLQVLMEELLPTVQDVILPADGETLDF